MKPKPAKFRSMYYLIAMLIMMIFGILTNNNYITIYILLYFILLEVTK